MGIREKFKGWKTILFNVGTLLVLAADQFGGLNLVEPKTVLLVAAIGNLALRFATNTAVGAKIALVAPLLFTLSLLSACTLGYRDFRLAIGHLPAGDEVQTVTVADTGLSIEPIGTGGPSILLGRREVKLVRVPGFEKSTQVPSVTVTTKLDVATGAVIEETLAVANLEPGGGGDVTGTVDVAEPGS